MADIQVDRKSSSSWIWWIVGLIILALIIWAIVEANESDEPDVAAAPVVATAPAVTPAPVAAVPAAPVLVVHEIVVGPEAWVGKQVSGTAQVSEVPTDRGFWLGSGADRIFVVLNDQPAEQPVNIDPGETVQLTNALVVNDFSKVPGTVDDQTRQIAEKQPVFLDVDESNVSVVSSSAAMPADTMQP